MDFFKNLKPGVRDLTGLIFFVLFWGFIYYYTESFPSGFHLGDDFEITNWRLILMDSGIITTIKDFLKEDLGIYIARYRPLWAIHRILAISVFDLNFSLYLAYIGLLAALTSFFLYKFCITVGFSFFQSVLFGIVSLIGNASVIWFEIADSENIGMFFLSLTLFFMAKSVYSNKNVTMYKVGFFIFLICMSACKESFILFIPPIMILYLWLYSQKHNTKIFIALKKNMPEFFITSIIFLGSLLMVWIFVLGNGPRYSGFGSGIFSAKALTEYFKLIFSLRISYLIITGILCLIIYKIIQNKKITGKSEILYFLKNNFLNITILFFLITLPQYLNYYKSSLLNRYYVPFILGFSFFLIFLYNRIMITDYISKGVKIVFSVLIIVFIFVELRINTIPKFRQYSGEQKVTNTFLKSITSAISKDSTVLIVMEPVQQAVQGIALLSYLRDAEDYQNIKMKFMRKEVISSVFSDTAYYNATFNRMSILYGKQSFDSIKIKDQINAVAILTGLEENFLKENIVWFNPMSFRREKHGGYVVYIKNGI